MRLKKIIATGIIAALTLSVAGCGKNASPASPTQEDASTTNADEDSSDESVEKDTDNKYEETDNKEDLDDSTDSNTGDYSKEDLDDTVDADVSYSPTEQILSVTPIEMKIQIGDTVYAPGSPIKDLFYGSWEVYMPTTWETADPDTRIDPGEKILLEFSRESEAFEGCLPVENSTNEAIRLEECTVASDFIAPVDFNAAYEKQTGFSGVTDEYYRENNNEYVWLPGGIGYKSTMDEVEEILGEPYAYKESHTSSADTKIYVGYLFPAEDGKNICYTFTFPDEKGAYIVNAGIGYEEGNEFWTY